ncbi:hypothetical protein T4C_12145 [Trichinella pseudospiralis]|uniref:Uncharacterized protein n=1 Tax=Trichinella pseudospiralis TaxID=6337 RepID=A0A0V1GWH9_TRIPS|nr:hypothetical protein T4C_7511 [Trichinella pseudospiralis]KRZ36612.1 hypothetical protein T4C_12145 [Trichinella pseudospiralis]
MLIHYEDASFLKISRETCLFSEKWRKIYLQNLDFF